jgi:hypothetical protein
VKGFQSLACDDRLLTGVLRLARNEIATTEEGQGADLEAVSVIRDRLSLGLGDHLRLSLRRVVVSALYDGIFITTLVRND